MLLSECVCANNNNKSLSRALFVQPVPIGNVVCSPLTSTVSLCLALSLSLCSATISPLQTQFHCQPVPHFPSTQRYPCACSLADCPFFRSLSLSRVCSLVCVLSRCRHSLRPFRCPVRTCLSSASCRLACAQPMSCASRAVCYVSFLLLLFVVFVVCVRVNCFCCSYCKHTQTSYTPPLDHTHRVTYTYTVTRQSFFDVFYFSQFSLDIYFAIVFALLFVQLTICVDNYRFDGKL